MILGGVVRLRFGRVMLVLIRVLVTVEVLDVSVGKVGTLDRAVEVGNMPRPASVGLSCY